MTELEAINRMLGYARLAPVSNLLTPHSDVPTALAILRRHSVSVQARESGWWFNREVTDLIPSAVDGTIRLPSDIRSVRVLDRQIVAVKRGEYMFNLESNTQVFTRKFLVEQVRILPFADLPQEVADLVAVTAAREYVATVDGDTATRDQITTDLKKVTIEANAAEINNAGFNVLDNSPGVQRMRSAGHQLRR